MPPEDGRRRAQVEAWAANEAERTEIEARIARLHGERVRAVRYLEIAYDDGQPHWSSDSFDSLDYGLEIDLDRGATWSVIWRQYDINEALLVYEGGLIGVEVIESAN